jgi:hypothetical protein
MKKLSCILLTLDAEVNHKVKREKGKLGFAGGGGELGECPPTHGWSAFAVGPGSGPGAILLTDRVRPNIFQS